MSFIRLAVSRAVLAPVVLATVVGAAAAGAGTVTVVVGDVGPAGAQGVASQESDVAPAIELDPTDFDPSTITDTEVSQMRSQLMSEQLTVGMIDRRASRTLADASAVVRTARRELGDRRDELSVLESTLGAAAIQGYISNSEANSFSFLGDDVESDDTFADETATQLLERRAEARQAVTEATTELARAEQDHRIATLRKRQAERSVEAVQERQEAFDELVERQSAEAERADAKAAALSDDVDLRSVAGALIVNASIEHDVDRLIADARADGLDLSGGGYRTIEAQIALRISHCGGSSPASVEVPGEDATPEERAAYEAAAVEHQRYVIYEMPASACSPPTATPGNSEHQQGLAIDFTQAGAILDRSSVAYRWLVEHAADYGLINLPSEAWHWSTTGS